MIKYTVIAAAVVTLIMFFNTSEQVAMNKCLEHRSQDTCVHTMGAQ